MVERLVHLGFEVRAELVRDDGERLSAQLTREQAEALELEQGQIVYVRPSGMNDLQLVRLPGVGVGRELLTDSGKSPLRDVGERDVLEHRAQVRAHGDPDVAQPLREPAYSTCSGPDAAHVRDRALDARGRRPPR